MMDGWMDGYVRWMDGYVRWMDGYGRWMDGYGRWIDGYGRWMDGWIRKMDRWIQKMDGWIRKMDGWIASPGGWPVKFPRHPARQPPHQPYRPPVLPRLERDETRRNRLPQPPRGGHCGKCSRARGRGERQRQYCQKDFVFRAKVMSKLYRGEETRYDVQIIHTYRNRFRLEHREFLWVPNVCDCPPLEEGRQYVLMVRRHINNEQTLNRILMEEDSYAIPYKPREDALLRPLEDLCSNSGPRPPAELRGGYA